MSKSVEEVRRAAFRKFFDGFQSTGEHCGVSIAESERELLELGFYAALDAVEIKLPPEVAQFADDDRGRRAFSLFTNTAIRSCRAAIEQTGLGLRVL